MNSRQIHCTQYGRAGNALEPYANTEGYVQVTPRQDANAARLAAAMDRLGEREALQRLDRSGKGIGRLTKALATARHAANEPKPGDGKEWRK